MTKWIRINPSILNSDEITRLALALNEKTQITLARVFSIALHCHHAKTFMISRNDADALAGVPICDHLIKIDLAESSGIEIRVKFGSLMLIGDGRSRGGRTVSANLKRDARGRFIPVHGSDEKKRIGEIPPPKGGKASYGSA